jgi:uncharacterized protein with NAD-binding domain and iron-sulfur cluster
MTMIGLPDRVVIAGGGLAAVRTAQALRELQHQGCKESARADTNIFSLVNDAKLHASRATARWLDHDTKVIE